MPGRANGWALVDRRACRVVAPGVAPWPRALLDPGCHIALDMEGFGGRMAYTWGSMLTAVGTGQPAYHTIFSRPFWEDLTANPEIAAKFDAMI